MCTNSMLKVELLYKIMQAHNSDGHISVLHTISLVKWSMQGLLIILIRQKQQNQSHSSSLGPFFCWIKEQHFFNDSFVRKSTFSLKHNKIYIHVKAITCLVKLRRLSWKINNKYWRHIAISHGGHGDHRPPEPIRNGLEVWAGRSSFSKIYCTTEQNNT